MSQKKITNVNKLKKEYLSGISAKQLSKKYQTSTNVITGTLKRVGLQLRSNSETAKLRAKMFPQDISYLHTPEIREKLKKNHADVKGDKNPNFQNKGKMSIDGVWLTYDKNGYLRRKDKKHPLAQKDGYIGEHVYQACKKYGLKQIIGKDIHHIDNVKDNNEWNNLIALTKSKHREIENNFKKKK